MTHTLSFHSLSSETARPTVRSQRRHLDTLALGLSISLAVVVAGCDKPQHDHETHEHADGAVGTVDFDVSCAAEVSDDFDHAVALLHHMQYDESRAAFQRIANTDPNCGMAQWGLAVTRFQPLWPSRPDQATLKQGSLEIKRARELHNLSENGSDRESDLIAAVEAFYREPETADWWTRIRRWNEAMVKAHSARPDDVETTAFYALSELAAAQVASDRMSYNQRAAAALLDIYERSPSHPGAVHYTIHANDVDSRADESLDVVRSYSVIAPEVPHALHMPTHIFVRLGEWPDVIQWNRRSANAALKSPVADGVSHHYVHALDYLEYAYLQQGDDEQALATLEELTAVDEPFQGTFISAFHLAALPARYAVERRAWDEARAISPRIPEGVAWDKFWWAESISWFARGLGAVHTGDAVEAERAEQRMVALRNAARDAGEAAFAGYIEIDRLVLASWRARLAGDGDEAVALAKQAVALETATEKHPVTPGAVYPAEESLGDLLTDLGQPVDALAAYENALSTWPGRFNSLAGAARAAQSAGRDDDARSYYQTLLHIAGNVNSDRPALAEARALGTD